MRLKDKVAIVTGGAHGMGEAEARLFAAEGAKVNVADILETEAQRVAANIRASGGEAMAAKIEVTSEPEWRALIAETGGVSPLSCRGVSSLYCAYRRKTDNRSSGKSGGEVA
jgi:NAD(P)-dependent dehydrogenase (short-subunit alcohol dehydrogenase family)